MNDIIKVLAAAIIITQNTVTQIAKHVFLWELPVYQEKYGVNCHVERTDLEVQVDALPDAAEEHARMHQAFGVEDETKQPFMDMAYGRGRAGIAALEKAIADAVVVEKPAAKAKAKLAREKGVTDPVEPPAGEVVAKVDAPDGNQDPLA